MLDGRRGVSYLSARRENTPTTSAEGAKLRVDAPQKCPSMRRGAEVRARTWTNSGHMFITGPATRVRVHAACFRVEFSAHWIYLNVLYTVYQYCTLYVCGRAKKYIHILHLNCKRGIYHYNFICQKHKAANTAELNCCYRILALNEEK